MNELVELFTLEGRAARSRFWFHLVLDGIFMTTSIMTFVILAELLGPVFALPILGVLCTGLWAALAVSVKRLHDMNRPGWHFLLLVVPIYNLYLGFLLFCHPGTAGPNRYGSDPLARRYWYMLGP